MDTLKSSIANLLATDEKSQVIENIQSLDLANLLTWLGQQDNSLRYNLALELDIPLQQLNTTCKTVITLSKLS